MARPLLGIQPERRGRPTVLYVSYDGALEPLGQSQVVSYLTGLADDHDITLLSFEKPEDLRDAERVARMEAFLADHGIRWERLRYHKAPSVPATAFDVLQGVARALRRARRRTFHLVHARGYVATLIGVVVKRLTGAALLFDMRGFWADEKVDGGHWSARSLLYWLTKRFERRFFESADAIVSLTQEGVRAFSGLHYRIRLGVPIEVIPTCADLERFAPGPKDPELMDRLGLEEGDVVIGCSGTMSNWYMRRPMLECLAYLSRHLPRAKVLIVTREDKERLLTDAAAAGVPGERLTLARVPFEAMPAHIRLMDLGVFFIKPCFAKKGSCATKLGEFLATGVPVVINDGVGDSGAIVREYGVGVVLASADASEFPGSLSAVQRLLSDPLTPKRCRAAAERFFNLQVGVEKYARLYDDLLARAGAGSRQ